MGTETAIVGRVVRGMLLLGLAGCYGKAAKNAGQALEDVVTIEYDQTTNFDGYLFDDPFNPSIGGTVTSIVTNDPQDKGPAVWAVYNICSVTVPKSRSFTFKRSKLNVNHQNTQFFAADLASFTFRTDTGVETGSTIPAHFRTETQLGNDSDPIPAGSKSASARRYLIFVRLPDQSSDPYSYPLRLFYDEQDVLMVSRNQDVAPPSQTPLTSGMLRRDCRPARK